jgi:hypothetical protein
VWEGEEEAARALSDESLLDPPKRYPTVGSGPLSLNGDEACFGDFERADETLNEELWLGVTGMDMVLSRGTPPSSFPFLKRLSKEYLVPNFFPALPRLREVPLLSASCCSASVPAERGLRGFLGDFVSVFPERCEEAGGGWNT